MVASSAICDEGGNLAHAFLLVELSTRAIV